MAQIIFFGLSISIEFNRQAASKKPISSGILTSPESKTRDASAKCKNMSLLTETPWDRIERETREAQKKLKELSEFRGNWFHRILSKLYYP